MSAKEGDGEYAIPTYSQCQGCVMNTFNPEYLDFYLSRGMALIRLKGKIPQDKEWSSRPTNPEDVKSHALKGQNVGWCVGAHHLIIDVDPRNGGEESFKKLCKDVGIDPEELIATYPTIRTGSGGMHVYMGKCETFGPKKQCRSYPGIDLIHGKNQVLIPGCVHPSTGHYYEPDFFSVWGDDPPEMPESIKAFLASTWGLLSSQREQGGAKTHLFGAVSAATAKQILDILDPVSHRDSWVDFILGLWHATGGAPEMVEALVDWSRRDPDYTDDPTVDARVEQIWGSARDDYDNPKTINSFLHHLRESKSDKASGVVRMLESELQKSEFEDLRSRGEEIEDTIKAFSPETLKSEPQAVHTVVEDILDVDDPTLLIPLKKQLAKALGLKASEVNQFFTKVKKKRKGKGNESKKNTNEWITELATDVLRKHFQSGARLCRAPNQTYYQYLEGVWRPTSSEHIRSLTMPHVRDTASSFDKQPFQIMSMTDAVESYIKAASFTLDSRLVTKTELVSAVNCKNGTLWIDKVTGAADFKDHNPEDYLTHQVPIVFDPSAECPGFDTMLEQVFEPLLAKYGVEEFEGFIRHWWEILGYTLQPHKTIPLVNLWFGGGLNGKTTIANVICALAGKQSVFSTQIGKFVDNSNSHLSAGLVGKLILMDDDVRAGTVLAEDILKAYSETKSITVNPKYEVPYETTVHVTPLLLANNRVLMLDRSHGMWRRLNVVPFLADLTPLRNSKLPYQVMEKELPGVLNSAIKGLQRLRKRGDFHWPKISIDARDEFFERSNPVCQYIRQNWQDNEKGSMPMATLYNSYQLACKAQGVKRVETYTRFTDIVVQMGYELEGAELKGLGPRSSCSAISG